MPSLQTVAHVDLNRYLGRWYEIARYPNLFERKCDHDVTADYSIRADGKIRVLNSCVTADGKRKQSDGTAIVVDQETNAKLKVTFFWPFYGKYWIIDLGTEYEYSVVSEPSRDYLWILSRSPELPESTYQQILSRLSEQDYKSSKLVKTRQTAHPR
jgi:apolipoprotein D and lipocalin family protein